MEEKIGEAKCVASRVASWLRRMQHSRLDCRVSRQIAMNRGCLNGKAGRSSFPSTGRKVATKGERLRLSHLRSSNG